jgi:hypothetical protein
VNLGAAASGANGNYGVWNRYLRQRQHRHDDARAKSQNFLIQMRGTKHLRCKYAPRPAAQRPVVHQHHRRREVTRRSRFGDSGATSQGRVRYDNNTNRLTFGAGGVSNQIVIVSSRNVGVSTASPWRTVRDRYRWIDRLAGSTGAGSLCLDGSKQVVYNSCLSSTRETKHDTTPFRSTIWLL